MSRLDELSNQVGDLQVDTPLVHARLNDAERLAEMRRRATKGGYATQMEERGTSVADIQNVVAEIAGEYGYEYRAKYNPRSGGHIVLMGDPGSAFEYERFKHAVIERTSLLGLPVGVSIDPKPTNT